MKPSDRIVLTALGIGGAVALGAYWWLPGAHWGVYVAIGLVVAGVGVSELLKDAANKKIIDGDR